MENKNPFRPYIAEADSRYREEILDFLEKKGFKMDKDEFRSREEIIGSVLPITVNMAEKTYRMMGSVMTAAAASSKGSLSKKEDLYRWFVENE